MVEGRSSWPAQPEACRKGEDGDTACLHRLMTRISSDGSLGVQPKLLLPTFYLVRRRLSIRGGFAEPLWLAGSNTHSS